MKFLSFLLFGILVGLSGFCQSAKPSPSYNQFNLPPGEVLNPKIITNIDYSYKLNQLAAFSAKNTRNFEFPAQYSTADIEEMKSLTPEKYQYFKRAVDYFNSLPERVKANFTDNELWYIYKFDQKLKNALAAIN